MSNINPYIVKSNINKNNAGKDKESDARMKRGQINSEDLNPFKYFSYKKLVVMLSDDNSQNRTIAAILLNKGTNVSIKNIKNIHEQKYVINELSNSFKKEKALYCRIAMQDSLASFDELAVPYLIQLLGKIGNNQEKELPKKYFNKKSFPLPRDLAARALTNVGKPAITYLMDVLKDNVENFDDNNSNINYDDFVKEQAIDAIGAIAYKFNDHRAINSLKNLFNIVRSNSNSSDSKIGNSNNKYYNNKNDIMMIWKIVRSLSGFKNDVNALNLVIDILNSYSEYYEIQWESVRSIGGIGIVNEDVKNTLNSIKTKLKNNSDDYGNSQVELSLKVALNSMY